MADLIVHRGGQEITKDELALIPLPQQTDSYTPVSHHQLANSLSTIGRDILTNYTLIGERYAIARNGNQLFAVLNFKADRSDMALSFGFRNSYDKSMSIGFCCGASVFVCDNMAFAGDIAVMRKHTKNVLVELEDLAITTLYKAQYTFGKLVKDSDRMKDWLIQDDSAFRLMGLLFGRDIISPRQIPVIREQWLKPQHPDFQPRSMWSFYNAVTESLKTCPPLSIMEKHIQAHEAITWEMTDV
jgi:hypothetical protein